MAKAKKQSEVITPEAVIENEPIVAETLDAAQEEAAGELENTVMEEAIADEPVAEETAQDEPAVVEPAESDEVAFLRHLLHIQDSGCWGKHLHPVIHERIHKLKA